MLIHGSRLYGAVDRIDDTLHVATRFFHLMWVPLIPTRTYIVLRQNGKSFDGIPIPMSGKSILFAWLRAALMIAGIQFLIRGIGETARPSSDWTQWERILLCSIGIGFLLFWWLSHFPSICGPSPTRAVALAQAAGASESAVQHIRDKFGLAKTDTLRVSSSTRAESARPKYKETTR